MTRRSGDWYNLPGWLSDDSCMRKPAISGLLSLTVVFLLAGFFYLRDLNATSLWEDESWLAIAIGDGLPDVLTFSIHNGVHPPLYFFLAWFFARFAGDSELALRWMGGLVTLTGLALTYRLGRAMGGHRAGFFAMLLAAGSIYLIYLTRLARQYTLFYTLSVLVVYAYWRWSKRPDSHKWLIILGVAQTAALYTHYFSAWIAVTVALHGLFTLRFRHWLKLAGALLLCGIVFALWLPALHIQIENSPQGGIGYAIRDNTIVVENFTDRIFNTSRTVGALLLIIGLIAIAIQRRGRAGLLLVIWGGGTFGAVLYINERLPVYVDRNMLYLLPAFVLVYGMGLAGITQIPLRRFEGRARLAPAMLFSGWMLALALAGMFVYNGISVYATFWPTTQNWREAARQMAEFAHPGDVYVVAGESWSIDYYMRRYLHIRLPFIQMDDWTAQPQPGERIWLIDPRMAVRFEAIDALPLEMVQTRRIVVLPIVAELYQRPPEQVETIFGGQIALGMVDKPEMLTAAPGETLTLEVWWRAERSPAFDYSVGVMVMGPAGRMAGQDGGFDNGRIPAQALPPDRWIPDTRLITLPPDIAPGEYGIFITVYDWRDASRLPTVNHDANNLYPLATLRVKAH